MPTSDQLKVLPPLHTLLRGRQARRSDQAGSGDTSPPNATEIGTLELYCVSPDGEPVAAGVQRPRHRRGDAARREAGGGGRGRRGLPRGEVAGGRGGGPRLLRRHPADTRGTPESPGSGARGDARELADGLCRRVWDDVAAAAPDRTRSPAHLARWYNLAGFTLRPGLGDPLDRYRVDSLWKIVSTAISAAARRPRSATAGRTTGSCGGASPAG